MVVERGVLVGVAKEVPVAVAKEVEVGVEMGDWVGVEMGDWVGVEMGEWVGVEMGEWVGVAELKARRLDPVQEEVKRGALVEAMVVLMVAVKGVLVGVEMESLEVESQQLVVEVVKKQVQGS